MSIAANVAGLMAEQARLTVAVDRTAEAMGSAIAEMALAIREHGEGSVEALAAEARADALFEEGERIAARLVEIEAVLAAETRPMAKAA